MTFNAIAKDILELLKQHTSGYGGRSAEDIAGIVGRNSRDVRRGVRALVGAGYPIISSPIEGFSYTEDPEKLRQYAGQLYRLAAEIKTRADSVSSLYTQYAARQSLRA